MTDLERMVSPYERIMWKGTPDKKCFILESIFNPLLPFAAIWFALDSTLIGNTMKAGEKSMMVFVAFFMLLHLMPVWIYLGGVFLSIRRYKHTQYIITDKGVYVSGGTFALTNDMKPFTELSNISIHRGIIDQKIGVGDVIMSTASLNRDVSYTVNGRPSGAGGFGIKDIKDYQRVYDLISRLQTDVYADTMYPNDLRPGTNHGYKTQYTPDDENR